MKQDAVETRLTHLKGVVNYLEATIKAPGANIVPDEREQVLLAAEE